MRVTLSVIIILCFCACSSKKHLVQSSGLVSEQSGTITIRCTGYGNNQSEAISSAEQWAVELILFRGMPDSQQAMPMITDEFAAKSKHESYFDKFLNGGRHKTFIMFSIPVSKFTKNKGTKEKSIIMDVRINLSAMRTDLEINGIVRKFGY